MKGLQIGEKTYDTAMWMRGYDSQKELGYTHNYVFSSWSENRLYNYYMSGDSRSYSF